MKPFPIASEHVDPNAPRRVSIFAEACIRPKPHRLVRRACWSALALLSAAQPLVAESSARLPGAGTDAASVVSAPITTRSPWSAAPRLPDLGPAPELAGISRWINSPPLTLASLRGRVVLVKFWTFSCINCRHTLPATQSWYERYHPKGFEIIAVHTPELDSERLPENVAAAVKRQAITYPVALDPAFITWNAYRNRYWPAVYLVDAKGRIRYTHIGEGDYAGTERAIRQLLGERDS